LERESFEDPTRTAQRGGSASEPSIGPYKLIRQIGEGGMGIVYYAQQLEPIRRDVALKVIKPGMDSRQVIARFESERQALALMDHANIATVFDAGTTTMGLPYFVMELVDGIPITRFCDSRRLTIRERVELFLPVCQAIQHAHQKGVIHRDIKPANILVKRQEGAAVPKVIDFGLAKALGAQLAAGSTMTHFGAVLGTFKYMSPEQAEEGPHDVDTRTDVYSLGTVLYELITGATPLEQIDQLPYSEILRAIREQEIRRPSVRVRKSTELQSVAETRGSGDPDRLPRLLDGELDWIVMKALEKDRSRRYESVSGLARDLQRFLVGEPVEAAPPSTAYRAGKFVRRHRVGLSVAAAFALLLVAGVVVSSLMALRASRAEAEARAVSDFFRNDVLAQASSTIQARTDVTPNPDLTVRAALQRAAARVEGKFTGQPLVEAAIRQTIAQTELDLGLYREAPVQAERALELRRKLLGPDHPDTLDSVQTLAVAHHRQANYKQAEPLFSQALDGRRRILGADHPKTLESMRALATVFTEQAKYAGAEPLHSEALEIARRTEGPDGAETLAIQRSLAVTYYLQGKYAQSEPLLLQTLEARMRVSGADHPDTLIAMNDLGTTYFSVGKWDEAESLYTRLLEIRTRVSGAEHPTTLVVMSNLGRVSYSRHRYEQAQRFFDRALEIRVRTSGESNPQTLEVIHNLGELDDAQGRYPQAEARFAKAAELRRRVFGEKAAATLKSLTWTGRAQLQQKQFGEAEATLRRALTAYEQNNSATWERYFCQTLLGATLAGQKKYSEAEPLLVGGYQAMRDRKNEIRSDYRPLLDELGPEVEKFYANSGQTAKAAR
jgi:eukaryotic-like serine/threonine-protein kinase